MQFQSKDHSGGIELAHIPEFRLAGRNQLVDRHRFDRAVVKYQCPIQQLGRRSRVGLRSVATSSMHPSALTSEEVIFSAAAAAAFWPASRHIMEAPLSGEITE